MKVVLFVSCFLPKHFYGTEMYTFYLAQNLRVMGYEVIVVSAGFPWEPRQAEAVTRYEYEGFPVYLIDKNYFPIGRYRDTYYQPAMIRAFKDLLQKLEPDIVHITSLANHTAVLPEVTASLGIPTVATLTDFFGICCNSNLLTADGSLCAGPDRYGTNCIICRIKWEPKNGGKAYIPSWARRQPVATLYLFGCRLKGDVARYRKVGISTFVPDIMRRSKVLTSSYNTCHAVIAPTRFLRDAYIANGLRAPIEVSHFGIDVSRGAKPARPSGVSIKFGFIGRIAPNKGLDLLLKAFARLPRGRAELLVYGSEMQASGYLDEVKSLAQGLMVSFQGTFPSREIGDVMEKIDFLVIPSRWYENSPLVLLNALASHTPVVVADVDGMTEFVEDGRNGFIFKREDSVDLERVLRMIIEEPSGARTMSLTTEYPRTTRMMAGEVVAMYEKVMAGKTCSEGKV